MRRAITLLGILSTLAFAVHAALSWLQAPIATYSDRPYGQIVFYQRVAERLARIPGLVDAAWRMNPQPTRSGIGPVDRTTIVVESLSNGGPMQNPRTFSLSYGLPLAAITVVAVAVLVLLRRYPQSVNERTPRQLIIWASIFALVMAFAVPVLVPDFWLSFAWGRTLWWGGNPYYAVPAQSVHDLPFDAPILRATYGPLWLHISWVVSRVTLGSVLWGSIVFKALLVTAWIGTLVLLDQLLRAASVVQRSMALVVVGWLPLGVVQTVGEGHNDIFMVAAILGWVLLLERGRVMAASISLALSVLVKYVSAPLFLLDLLYQPIGGGPRRPLVEQIRRYLPRALVVALLVVLAFAPVFRGLDFFRSTGEVRAGYFFLPADAVMAIGTMAGLNLFPLALAVQAIFPLVTLWTLWRYSQSPSREHFRLAVAGIMLSVLFVVAGHVWPWYVIWLLAVAALVPSSTIFAWTTGVALGAPVILVPWTAYPPASEFVRFQVPSLVVYATALVWTVWLGRSITRAAPDSSRAA
jgi:alpha-1,6-mannosyltransferase